MQPAEIERLYRQHGDRLIRFATRGGITNDVAEEVVQDAFLALTRQPEGTSDDEAVRALFRLVRSKRSHRHREQKRRQAREQTALGKTGIGDDHADAVALRALVRTVLSKQPANEQALARLLGAGRTVDEITGEMQIGRRRLETLRRRLREAFGDSLVDGKDNKTDEERS